MARIRLLLALAVTLAAGCSAASSNTAQDKFFGAPTGASGVSSNTNVERYFPLVDGMIYSYATSGERDKGLLIARVHRTDETHGELTFPTGKKRFVYAPEGVRLEPGGGFVLAGPIQQGTSFRGQNGGRAVIQDVGVVMDVKAGRYQDCVRVVEERGGDRRARYTTTFCPDVGVVAIEAEADMTFERAELLSYGPPVNINDGTTVVPPPDNAQPPP